MRALSSFPLLGLALLVGCGIHTGVKLVRPQKASECQLATPIDIGTNDPRRDWRTDKLITLTDVAYDHEPQTALLNFPAASGPREIVLFGIYVQPTQHDPMKATGWLGAEPSPQQTDKAGFAEAYAFLVPKLTGSVQVQDGTYTYSTTMQADGDDFQSNDLRAVIQANKLLSLELKVPNYVANNPPSNGAYLTLVGQETLCVKTARLK